MTGPGGYAAGDIGQIPAWALREARRRLSAVLEVEVLSRSLKRTEAVATVAAEHGINERTVRRWLRATAGVPVRHIVPALAPRYRGRTATAECDPRAWEFLVRLDQVGGRKSFAASHRLMLAAAGEHGWAPIPSGKTLKRRLDRAAVPAASRRQA